MKKAEHGASGRVGLHLDFAWAAGKCELVRVIGVRDDPGLRPSALSRVDVEAAPDRAGGDGTGFGDVRHVDAHMVPVVDVVDPLEAVKIPKRPAEFIERVVHLGEIDVGRADVRGPERLCGGRCPLIGSGPGSSGQQTGDKGGESCRRHAHGADPTRGGGRLSKREASSPQPSLLVAAFVRTWISPPRCSGVAMRRTPLSISCSTPHRAGEGTPAPEECGSAPPVGAGLPSGRHPRSSTRPPPRAEPATPGRELGRSCAGWARMLAPPAKGGAFLLGGRSPRRRRTRVALTGVPGVID